MQVSHVTAASVQNACVSLRTSDVQFTPQNGILVMAWSSPTWGTSLTRDSCENGQNNVCLCMSQFGPTVSLLKRLEPKNHVRTIMLHDWGALATRQRTFGQTGRQKTNKIMRLQLFLSRNIFRNLKTPYFSRGRPFVVHFGIFWRPSLCSFSK